MSYFYVGLPYHTHEGIRFPIYNSAGVLKAVALTEEMASLITDSLALDEVDGVSADGILNDISYARTLLDSVEVKLEAVSRAAKVQKAKAEATQ